jgi:hypothetical protein
MHHPPFGPHCVALRKKHFNTEKKPRTTKGHGESRMALRSKCPASDSHGLSTMGYARQILLLICRMQPPRPSVALGFFYHENRPPYLGGRSDRKKNQPQMYADSITYLRASVVEKSCFVGHERLCGGVEPPFSSNAVRARPLANSVLNSFLRTSYAQVRSIVGFGGAIFLARRLTRFMQRRGR